MASSPADLDIEAKGVPHDVKVTANDAASSSSSDRAETEAFLSTFTAEEHNAVMKKVDRRFLLLIGLMYMLKNIDYMNAAVVKVLQVGQPRNILKELNMTADEYNWVQSIYFISYIVFEVPSNLMLKKMSPRVWQARIIFSWGLVLACHAAVRNKEGLYACRFFLGMMEAGLFPGLAAQLCSWYRSDEMGKPIMWMFGWQNCAGIVGSIIAYGLSYLNGRGGLSGWQWVYLLEGLFTVLFAGIVWWRLPDYPKSKSSNSWLTEREQEYLEVRLATNAPRTGDSAFSKSEIIASLKNPRTYSFCVMQVFMNLGGYGLQWQLPTVTTNLGFAGLPRNQLLNIAPAAASVLAIIFAGWFLGRAYLTRPQIAMFICAGALSFFLVLLFHVSNIATYMACIFGTMFYSVYFIPFWACKSSDTRLRLPLTILSRALSNAGWYDWDSLHTGIPILHRAGRRCGRSSAIPFKVCIQRLQNVVWDLRRGHWDQLDC
jgi:sugar phosphate permease